MANAILLRSPVGPQPKPVLTPRQMEVAGHMLKGLSDKQIAEAIGVGHATLKTYNVLMFNRVGVRGRFAFMAWFRERFSEVSNVDFIVPDGPVRTSCFE